MVRLNVSISRVALLSTIQNGKRFSIRQLSSFSSIRKIWNENEKVQKQQICKAQCWYGTSSRSSANFSIEESIKHVTIQTCGQLYQEWSQTKKFYSGAPKEGLSLNVEYVDTKEFIKNDKAPVVLTLHGAPGTHKDFHPLINYLTTKGIRVISPNWPEYSIIDRTKYFRHSTEEKTEYLHDFLKSIDIERLDMLVMHSSSVYPALELAFNRIPVRSFAFLAIAGHRRTKVLQPAFYADNTAKFALSPMGRKIYRKLSKYIHKVAKSTINADNPDNVLLASAVMYQSGWSRLYNFFESIKQQKPNVLFVFAENDRLIEKEAFYEMVQLIGAQKAHFTVYDGDGGCVVTGKKDDWIRVIKFQKGGHYPFLKYPDIVNPAIEEVVRK